MTTPNRLLGLLLLTGCDLLEPSDGSAPALSEIYPEDGDTGPPEVTLSALVSDGDDSLVRVSVAITSDVDGELCVRVPGVTGLVACDVVLSAGAHTLTFTATDQADKSDEQSVSYLAAVDDSLADGDGDGFTADEDCDDADAATYPGADEVCDGVDNDCDDEIDEDAIDPLDWYIDGDGDGYGTDDDITSACDAPSGYAAETGDCDDTDETVSPGEAEVCDAVDNDCDDQIDEGVTATFYADGDADGYGDPEDATDACDAPSGYADNADDCDDTSDLISPDAAERTDGVDNDCDDVIDELDGDWAGTIELSIDGGGTCIGDLDVNVDTTAKVVISGAGDCGEGVFEDVTFAGDFTTSPDAEGTLAGTLAGSTATSASWAGDFSGNSFRGSFSGEAADKKQAWTYSGTFNLSR